MEAKWLDDFIALAEVQSFTRAAQESHCSQSALSRRIQSLERWIGAELIDRDAYPMRLTPAGQRFLEVSKGLKGTIEAARQLGKATASPSQDQHLTIALPGDISGEKTAQVFSRIAAEIPNLRVTLVQCAVPQILGGLLDGKADFGLISQFARIPHIVDGACFEQWTVGRDSLRMFCGGTPDQMARFLWPLNGRPIPLLCYDVSSYLAQVSALALSELRRTVQLECICEASTPQNLAAMVRNGLGLALLPDSLAAHDTRLRPLPELDSTCKAELSVLLVRPARDIRRPHYRGPQKLADRVRDIFADGTSPL